MLKKIADETKIKIILLVGIILRIYYVIATPVVQNRQYDLGSVDASQNIFTGHLGYIYYLFTYRHVIETDPREIYQFFHPPLHHGIEAFWLSLINIFTKDFTKQIEWLQVPVLAYSIVLLFVVLELLKELDFNVEAKIIVIAIVAFHPTLIFMAGSLNNDGLSVLFQFMIIWLTVRWNKNKTCTNIIWIALSIGFGMLTKLSVGLMAIPVAFVFAYSFVAEWTDNKKFPLIRFFQYVIFGVFCIPIGLAWAIRCLIKFDMPLMYVNKLPQDSWQYVGNYSLWQRFGIPNPMTLVNNLMHGSLGFGENMWMQMFRTAALGECDLGDFSLIGKVVSLLMIFIATLLALMAFIAFVKVIIIDKNNVFSQKEGREIKWFFVIVYVAQFFSYVKFCYGYPHQCTMNFRYMVPTILVPALALGEEMSVKTSQVKKITVYAFSIIALFTVIIWGVSV